MKIKVNSENYERFIVDYYDGQLSPEEEQSLLYFLERHPDLKEAFVRFADAPALEKEEIVFPEKAALKHPEIKPAGAINEENYPEYFVLAQDGELPEKAQRQLQFFLAENSFLKGEYQRFALARLSPDKTIVFENKAQLKKRAAGIWLPYAVVAAAAVLLLLFGLRFLFPGAGNPKTARPLPVVRPLAEKTVETTVAVKAGHKIKTSPVQPEKHPAARKKNHKQSPKPVIPMRHYKPVKMLASATIYPEINRQEDYFPLLFPQAPVRQENLALSTPVVVEKPVHNRFIRNSIGKPFSELAAVIAVQKKKRKTAGTRDKPFVKVLEGGVTALNVLTDQDLVMVKTYDANGHLIDYQLLSDNFSINRPVKGER